MPYEVEGGAIAQITIVQSLFGQTLLNMFHYKLGGSGGPINGVTAMDTFVDALQDPVNGPLLSLAACQSQDVLWTDILGQWIFPARFAYLRYPPSINGGSIAQDSAPPNVAAAVLKRSLVAGPTERGVMHIGGVPQNSTVAGNLTVGYKATVNAFADKLPLTFEVLGKTWTPVLFNKLQPAQGKVVEMADALNSIRVIRRRTVGVGI